MARPNMPCQINTFCGCIPLERGVLIIGIISMFVSLTELFRISLHFVDFELSLRHCQRLLKDLKKAEGDNKVDGTIGNETREKCPHESLVRTMYSTLGLQAILCIVYFILSVQLVYGVKMGRPRLLLPWMLWQAAPIFYAFISIFVPNNPPVPVNMVSFLFIVYFLLVVFSYYNEATTRERPVAVTVVAVTQTPSGMTVTIPSPGKDDAPPPYPGYISEFNPAYSSTDETSAPPYTSMYMSNYATPPPYSQIVQQSPGTTQQNPGTTQQSPGTTQQSQGNTSSEHSAQNSSQNSAAGSPAETCREAVPLVKKSLQSNE
ncbi:uncharacterized protein LOC134779220 [Penaeus indicus]|uniref:uncharacterized protein LOC134779220 n=1 Tax=Penaeus indicus TaxID=29960 RepID=UPI00300CC5D3